MGNPIVEIREPGRSALRLVVTAPIAIGRDCDGVLLSDAMISRRHVELRPLGARLEVVDLASSNGSFIGAERISRPTVLAPGMVLRIGATTIELVEAESTQSSTPVRRAIGKETSIDLVAELALADVDRLDDLSDEHRHGTVTILFSDIESSTELVGQLGDERWMAVLGRHNEIMRSCIHRAGGTVVKHQGDGFMVTFPSARRAVQAALHIQEQLATTADPDSAHALRVRIGMHTGEVIIDDAGDLFGRHVHYAARVAAQATGGEVVVSALTKAILETRSEITFGEPRLVELKGLPGRHSIHPVLPGSLREPAAGGDP